MVFMFDGCALLSRLADGQQAYSWRSGDKANTDQGRDAEFAD